MASKDKESKTLQDKLKQFFKLNSKQSNADLLKGPQKFALTPEMENLISQNTPISQRIKAIKELSDAVLSNQFENIREEHGSETPGGSQSNLRDDKRKIADRNMREKSTLDCIRSWSDMEKVRRCLADLFHRDVSKEIREIVFQFYLSLVQGQYDKLGSMRVYIFEIIKTHDVSEDIALRLELLNALTENGRDIGHMEEDMGEFVLQWMPEIVTANLTVEYLDLLNNLIKFNAAYIEEAEITNLIRYTCFLCCHHSSDVVVKRCLQLLNTVLCYSNLPTASLDEFVSALCRTVTERFCDDSWEIMRKLLGTHLGHAALFTLCRILQDSQQTDDVKLLRGAVFYISMGLFGNKSVPTLKCNFTAVLPSILQAVRSGYTVVVYEVVISCQRLVTKYGRELHDPSWDLILQILEGALKFCATKITSDVHSTISSHIHETISTIEKLIETDEYNGSIRPVYELAEKCAHVRPETSVLRLVQYLASSARPTNANWISKLHSLLDKFFKQETRTVIRTKVLDVLSNIIHTHRAVYEDELIEQIVVPYLGHPEQDSDVAVRSASAQLLIDLCIDCETKKCVELLDILEKLLNHPFEQPVPGGGHIIEADVPDVRLVASGLVRIFVTKMYRLPSCHATRAYYILVSHLENHYRQPSILEHAPAIRHVILECFLNLRSNSFYHLGYAKSRGITHEGFLDFSPYLAVDHKHCERTGGASSPTPVSPAPTPYPPCIVTSVPLTRACRVIINCLSTERDWLVLNLVLKEIPHVLKNKALFSSRHGSDIDQMACALISLMNDKTVLDTLRNTPAKFPRSEFQGFIFPVLTSLASYHTHLDPVLQQRLIVCLELGLQTRFASLVVGALTTCILEMKDAMYKRLPEVLLNLSKISATVHIAIPILSFLSTLTRLPKVFASFVGDQYMSVFAICLPYTNPFRYNHFTVSLAHHVIAAWFLKCRLPFRRDFVKFITTGLKANVILPIEEGHSLKGDGRPDVVNEDSSSRKRSSSLTEQGNRRRPIGSSRLDTKPVDVKTPIDDALHTFHLELTETCIDLMARYTFSTCSAMPKRLPQMQTLLEKGQSNTWLLGTKLITVTTSACNQKVLRMGLCDKCWTSCRLEQNPTTPQEGSALESNQGTASQDQTANEGIPSKVALQRSSSADVAPMSMRDDLAPGSASASSSAGGSARSLSLLVQSSSNSGDTDGPPPTGRSSAAINSPSDETRKLPMSLDAMEPETSKLDQLLFGFDRLEGAEKQQCSCWCNGWAEIHVRRPTGDMSWAMRLQNRTSSNNVSLSDLATLYLPSADNRTEPTEQLSYVQHTDLPSEAPEPAPTLAPVAPLEPVQPVPASQNASSEPMAIHPSPVRCSPSRQSSRDSLEEEGEEGQGGDSDIDDGNGRARNPVRRSNSSPEMSGAWRNPFLAAAAQDREKMDKMTKPSYSKDLRANCEAIPEEIAGLGTTPPSSSPTVAKFPPTQPPLKRPDVTTSTSRVSTGPTITTVSSPSRNPALHSSSTSPVPSNPPTAALLHSSKQTSPLTKSSSPLLLPSSLSSKPPLSPTQARHQTTDNPEPEPKTKFRSVAPSDLKLGLGNVPSSRLNEVRMGASRLSSASGSAASSAAGSDPTLGSSSSLDSRAGNEALQMQSSAPASPTTSHTHHLSASAELINRDEGDLRPDPASLPKLQFNYRDRGYTISVMSPVRKPPRSDWDAKRTKALSASPRVKETQRPNVNPILVFLQLYHSAYFGSTSEKPLLVPNTPSYARSIKNFDRIQPYENHKVGVLYVGRGQANSEVDILRNTVGSLRYTEFLQRLGSLINLQETDPQATFLGGLDRTGRDGKFAYFWQDDITQVIFFATTLMPNHDNDLTFTEKKKHIGNAYVTIVYNESGEEYNIQTIKGQYNYVVVEIKPMDHGKNEVRVCTSPELKDSGVACEPKVASDANLAVLARQLALHASLASVVSSSLKLSGNSTTCNPYASNWLERLRSLKQIRERLLKEVSNEEREVRRERRDEPEKPSGNNSLSSAQSVSSEVSGRRRHQMDDFTEYT